jgi:hypothetical protein
VKKKTEKKEKKTENRKEKGKKKERNMKKRLTGPAHTARGRVRRGAGANLVGI